MFSAELPWCCFCVEIEVLRIGRNFLENYFRMKKNIGTKNTGGGALPGHKTPRCATPQGRPGGLWGPRGSADPNSSTINSYFWREKWRGSFIAFHDTKPSPPPVLHQEARSGGCSGLQRGESLVFIITNPPSSPIP